MNIKTNKACKKKPLDEKGLYFESTRGDSILDVIKRLVKEPLKLFSYFKLKESKNHFSIKKFNDSFRL